jgi:hypothetical protein
MTKDEFIAELLRKYPELKVEVLPNGKRVIRGIGFKSQHEPDGDDYADRAEWKARR